MPAEGADAELPVLRNSRARDWKKPRQKENGTGRPSSFDTTPLRPLCSVTSGEQSERESEKVGHIYYYRAGGENSYFSVKKKPLTGSASRSKNSNGWKI